MSDLRKRLIKIGEKDAAEFVRLLEAENAALRVDALRYRWLREQNYYVDATLCVVDRSEDHPRLADLDAAIDAAQEKP